MASAFVALASLMPLGVAQPMPLQAFRASLAPYVQAARACSSVFAAPSDSGSWSDLGAILHQRGRLGAAQVALARAAELAPADAALALRLATVLREVRTLVYIYTLPFALFSEGHRLSVDWHPALNTCPLSRLPFSNWSHSAHP